MWQGLASTRSQPWETGAFNSDGSLRCEFLARAHAVIEAADKLGMVVCLGLFYFGQDERLVDENAVLAAVDGACGWVLENGFTNVVIEIANEVDIPLYEHEVLTAPRVHTLIERVRAIEYKGAAVTRWHQCQRPGRTHGGNCCGIGFRSVAWQPPG